MEKKIKYAAAILVVVFAVGCVLWAPQALAWNGRGEDEDQEGWRKLSVYGWWRQRPRPGLWFPFLRNGTLETLTGEAVAVDGQVLVVEASGDYVNIMVPKRWIVGREVMDVEELFEEGGPLEYGETLTVSLLEYEVSGRDHSVTFLFAYKMVQGGTTARAVLPFNIRTTS